MVASGMGDASVNIYSCERHTLKLQSKAHRIKGFLNLSEVGRHLARRKTFVKTCLSS
jgi:hypothetical protein